MCLCEDQVRRERVDPIIKIMTIITIIRCGTQDGMFSKDQAILTLSNSELGSLLGRVNVS